MYCLTFAHRHFGRFFCSFQADLKHREHDSLWKSLILNSSVVRKLYAAKSLAFLKVYRSIILKFL